MKKPFLLRVLAAFCLLAVALPLFAACGEETAEFSDDVSQEESSTPKIENENTVTVGETVYEISAPVNSEINSKGVYIFTAEYGSAPKAECMDGDYFDVAVIDGIAAEVYEKGTSAVIPADGYILRFCQMGEASVALGGNVKCDMVNIETTPVKYVRLGNNIIEIGHENEIRTAEDIGWLYDNRWYSSTTTSNIWCTEVAVLDGKVVEINRSGDNVGDTAIPEGGYVVALGQGSSAERKVSKLKVGDSAELFLGEKLYNVKRFGFSGTNRSRPENGIVVFVREGDKTTTPIGNNLTEVAVNKSGRITGVYTNCSGMKKIPENGFVISATGDAATALLRVASVGNKALQSGKVVYVISTPDSLLEKYKSEFSALQASYDEALQNLDFVDFQSASKLVDEINQTIQNADLKNGETLATAITSLQELIPRLRAELVPQITVQDRTAWVTLGEYNTDNSILLHYKTPESVDHTVAYAKGLGLNTLIIDNLAAGFGVYNSEVPGIVKLPQLGEVDLLAEFQRACDEQGLRLIIMVNAFSSGIKNVAYPANHYMSIYKDKYLKTNKGNHVGPDNVITLDPADKDVQAFNLAVLAELCENYDVYGIQADYMRYPLPYFYQEHNYEDFGYNESSVAGFIKKYGKDPATIKISDPLWEKWCAWRRDIISDYQKRFYQTAKEINPNLNVSFTCFADYRDRQLYTYQDVEKWAENGYADAIYPMIYGATTEYQLGYAQQILPITQHTDLVFGVGTYVKATHESMKEQLIMPYALCAEGVSVFTLRYISTCGYDSVYRETFRTPATPATAPDSELVPACKEMLFNRLNNLLWVSEKKGKADSNLELLITAINDISTENLSMADFCTRLKVLRDDYYSAATLAHQTVPDLSIPEAAAHVMDYVLGLE